MMAKLVALLVAVVALALGLVESLQLFAPDPPDTRVVTLLSPARPPQDFLLSDQDGQSMGREVFRDQWTLVFFGFTSCGHICPGKMAELRMIRDRVGPDLQVMFISVDPGRDTPAVIKQYVERFDPDFRGATGSATVLDQLTGAFGAPYFVDPKPGAYVVDHSTAFFLVAPDARLAGTITPPIERCRLELRPLR